ncbi:hypothetical protein CK203_061824 [Vitis vinifera]|uniref:Uncharacterized protein n=1 Tax=Vitis vinifera TaxID=29760 RepID=A0A438GJ17_VITVI|nr:hypothetical protein CK203_061824 [Vitis vinifera]
MATPSRSRSSVREDNSEWRQAIERRQLASERQLKVLLQETERLREEKRRYYASSFNIRPPRRQRSRGQVANSRPEPESIYPGTTGVIPEACNAIRAWETKATSSHNRGNAPRPYDQPRGAERAPHRDPMVTPMVRNVHPHLAVQQAGRNLPNEPPIGSISKRLDDMLSTPFALTSFITSPKGIPRTKIFHIRRDHDPFDHIMHYRQLMTLDIGNDALLCKCSRQPTRQSPISWFHRLPPNSVGNFRDLVRISWDNTCAPLDTSRTSALCKT